MYRSLFQLKPYKVIKNLQSHVHFDRKIQVHLLAFGAFGTSRSLYQRARMIFTLDINVHS